MNETLPRPRGRPRKRSPKGCRFQQVTVQLPPDLVADLDRHAEGSGLDSRSALIRTACREHLRRLAKRTDRDAGEKG